MTNYQESFLSMSLGLRDFLTSQTTITNALPNFAANFTVFNSTISLIQATSTQQKQSKTGITVNKKQLKEKLIVTTADYARKLMAYASFTSNSVLLAEVNMSESKLRKAADTALRDYGQLIYDRAQSNLASLSAYSITAATQTTLLNSITSYNTSIGKPAAGKTESTQVTKQLSGLFKTINSALANMDKAVEIVRLTQVSFYNGYKSARKVVVTGTSSLAIKCMVTEAKSGNPLKGVTVSFTLNGTSKTANSKPDLVKKTAEKGGFIVKSIPEGVYSVTLKKTGYIDQTVTLNVSKGELAILNVELEKA